MERRGVSARFLLGLIIVLGITLVFIPVYVFFLASSDGDSQPSNNNFNATINDTDSSVSGTGLGYGQDNQSSNQTTPIVPRASGGGGGGGGGSGSGSSESGTGGGNEDSGNGYVAGGCMDGIDNDFDGLVDWQYDLGCYGSEDMDERAGGREAEQNWTTYDPVQDGFVFYVSFSEGRDSWSGLAPHWNGTDGPRRTVAGGMALIRKGRGDWLLFKRGDQWDEQLLIDMDISGRSVDERTVLASYGNSTQRPLFKSIFSPIGILYDGGILMYNGGSLSIAYLSIVGLDFYFRTYDPSHPEFQQLPSVGGTSNIIQGTSILVEDCSFRFAPTMTVFGSGIELRRNQFINSLPSSTTSSLFIRDSGQVLVEDNLFDNLGEADSLPYHHLYIRLGNWNNFNLWKAVTNGTFNLYLRGLGQPLMVSELDFSSVATMQAVALEIEQELDRVELDGDFAVGWQFPYLWIDYYSGGVKSDRTPIVRLEKSTLPPSLEKFDLCSTSICIGRNTWFFVDYYFHPRELYRSSYSSIPVSSLHIRDVQNLSLQGNIVSRTPVYGMYLSSTNGSVSHNLFLENVNHLALSTKYSSIDSNVFLYSKKGGDYQYSRDGRGIYLVPISVSESSSHIAKNTPVSLEITKNIITNPLRRDANEMDEMGARLPIVNPLYFQLSEESGSLIPLHNSYFVLRENIMYQVTDERSFGERPLLTVEGSEIENSSFLIESNHFQSLDNLSSLIHYVPVVSGKGNIISFKNNSYFSRIDNDDKIGYINWFFHGTDYLRFTDWKSLTGDDSRVEQVTYVDPNRNVSGYLSSIGFSGDVAEYLLLVRNQSRLHWNVSYTSYTFNHYIRDGFALPPPQLSPLERKGGRKGLWILYYMVLISEFLFIVLYLSVLKRRKVYKGVKRNSFNR